MNRTEAITWFVGTLTGSLHWRQAQTLAELATAVLRVKRVSLPAIAQCLQIATTRKHRIKRVWRFLDNPRIEISQAMRTIDQAGFTPAIRLEERKPPHAVVEE